MARVSVGAPSPVRNDVFLLTRLWWEHGRLPERERLESEGFGIVVDVAWELSGAAGKRDQRADGTWLAISAEAGSARARRTWALAGGTAAMREEERAWQRMHDARMMAAIAQTQGGQACLAEKRALMRWAADAQSRCSRRQVAGVTNRTLENALVTAGLAADGRVLDGQYGARHSSGGRAFKRRWTCFLAKLGRTHGSRLGISQAICGS